MPPATCDHAGHRLIPRGWLALAVLALGCLLAGAGVAHWRMAGLHRAALDEAARHGVAADSARVAALRVAARERDARQRAEEDLTSALASTRRADSLLAALANGRIPPATADQLAEAAPVDGEAGVWCAETFVARCLYIEHAVLPSTVDARDSLWVAYASRGRELELVTKRAALLLAEADAREAEAEALRRALHSAPAGRSAVRLSLDLVAGVDRALAAEALPQAHGGLEMTVGWGALALRPAVAVYASGEVVGAVRATYRLLP